MGKARGVDGSTGAISGLGSAQDAGKKTREGLSLPLSKDTSDGVKQLATGFGLSRTVVLSDLGKRVEGVMQQHLRDLYEKYDTERRKSLGGLFGKPDPAAIYPGHETKAPEGDSRP